MRKVRKSPSFSSIFLSAKEKISPVVVRKINLVVVCQNENKVPYLSVFFCRLSKEKKKSRFCPFFFVCQREKKSRFGAPIPHPPNERLFPSFPLDKMPIKDMEIKSGKHSGLLPRLEKNYISVSRHNRGIIKVPPLTL